VDFQQVMGPGGRFARDYAAMKTVCVEFSKDVSFEDFKPQFVSKLKGKGLLKFISEEAYKEELPTDNDEHMAQMYVYNCILDSLQAGKRFGDIRAAGNSPYRAWQLLITKYEGASTLSIHSILWRSYTIASYYLLKTLLTIWIS